MATIYDVAREAGVSHTTVSRIINKKKGGVPIKEETRARVLEAIKRLGYQPNRTARNLRLQRTNNIGFLLCQRILTHLYYYRLLKAVEQETTAHGLHLIFATYDGEGDLPLMIKEKNVDGILVTGRVTSELVDRLKETQIPYIVLGSLADTEREVNIITGDVADELAEGVEYLLARGHKDIAYITDYREPLLLKKVYTGYREAYARAGLPAREELVVTKVTEAYPVLKEFLPAHPEVTALILQRQFVNDLQLYTAEKKLRIPEDLSVIVFGEDALDKRGREFFHYLPSGHEATAREAISQFLRLARKEISRVSIYIPTRLHEGKSVSERCRN